MANNGKKKKKVIFTIGMEVEMMLLNNSGHVVSKADELKKKLKKKFPEVDATKEAGRHMFELRVLPHHEVSRTALNLLDGLGKTAEVAREMDLHLFPHGTYPGEFDPQMRSTGQYAVKEKIFGPRRWRIAGRCTGFHFHYRVPFGVLDRKKLMLRPLTKSKEKESLINSYNLMLAMDPVVSTLMQSSPFYQGKFYGKDSRAIWYRGDPALKNPKALYSKFPRMGGLPVYIQTGADLINRYRGNFRKWKEIMVEAGLKESMIRRYKSSLDTAWNPLRVNKLGTLEQRGMDMNHPKYIIGSTLLLSSVLKHNQEEYWNVKPSDIGIKDPFKKEGKTLYIAPRTEVKQKLQMLSACKGFESKEVYHYCKHFFKFARGCMKKKDRTALRRVEYLFRRKKTVSDILIRRAKKMGYSKKDSLPKDAAAEMALKSAEQVLVEIPQVKRVMEKMV